MEVAVNVYNLHKLKYFFFAKSNTVSKPDGRTVTRCTFPPPTSDRRPLPITTIIVINTDVI